MCLLKFIVFFALLCLGVGMLEFKFCIFVVFGFFLFVPFLCLYYLCSWARPVGRARFMLCDSFLIVS